LLDGLFEQPAVFGEAIRDPLQFVSYRVHEGLPTAC
jgi:hypothetical protein